MIQHKIETNKSLFKEFYILHGTAYTLYRLLYNGLPVNFYGCYLDNKLNIFKWEKENNAFTLALHVYSDITYQSPWRLLMCFEDVFGQEELSRLSPYQIELWGRQIN